MKKILATFVLSLFLVPSFAFAQTAPTDAEIRDQYQAALVQLITLLQQQVADLLAQLQEVKATQTSIANDVKDVKTNTTQSTGGSVDNTVEVRDPFTIVEFKFENGSERRDIYYRGNDDLSSIEVSGYDGTLSRSYEFTFPNGTGKVIRFTPSEPIPTGQYPVTLTSVHGDVYHGQIDVIPSTD